MIARCSNSRPTGKKFSKSGTSPRRQKTTRIPACSGYPAGLFVDDAAHEIYIADGYLNNRVVVYNSDTGAFKRGWGAYGIPLSQVTNDIEGGDRGLGLSEPRDRLPAEARSAGAKSVPPYSSKTGIIPIYKAGDPPDKQFRSPVHCAAKSTDGLVYVCDRHNNRIQVFTPEGKFIKEFFLRTATLGNGSTWYVLFSPDKAQKYLYVVDGENNHIWTMRRSDGVVVSSFGRSGRMAGQFHEVHSIAMDSKGNLYTGEVAGGERIQKFVPQPGG